MPLQKSKLQPVTHLGHIQYVLWNEMLPSCLIGVRFQPDSQAPRWTDGGILLYVAVVSQHLQKACKGQNTVHGGRPCGKVPPSAWVITSSSLFPWDPWG